MAARAASRTEFIVSRALLGLSGSHWTALLQPSYDFGNLAAFRLKSVGFESKGCHDRLANAWVPVHENALKFMQLGLGSLPILSGVRRHLRHLPLRHL
jgi:hypothetical protein